jgi:hypothetical protein
MYLHGMMIKESLLNQRVSSADAEAPERSGSTNTGGISNVLRGLVQFNPETVSKVVDVSGASYAAIKKADKEV